MDRQASQPSRKPESTGHGRGKFDIFIPVLELELKDFWNNPLGTLDTVLVGVNVGTGYAPLSEQRMSNRVYASLAA
jgi:hypothetical protein